MVELRDRESQLEEFARLIGDCGASPDTPKKPDGQKAFADIALGSRFKALDAIKEISEPPDGYRSFREVLFLGICGWVTSPTDDTYGSLLMQHGVFDYLSELEGDKALRHLSPLQKDFVVRYILAGEDFLTDIFYPLGGHKALATSISREYLQDWHYAQAGSIRQLAKACGVLHFAAMDCHDPAKYHAVSQRRAVIALTSMNKGKSVRSTLLDRWTQNDQSLALLYAASTIKSRGETLLDAILSSEIRAKEFLPKLGEWLSRARYFCDLVLSKLGSDDDQYEVNLKPLMPFAGKRFSPPVYSSEHESLIREAFLLKKINKESKRT